MKFQELRSQIALAGCSTAYSIAFGMRSGSTALANALYSSGMGKPDEYFQYPYELNPHGKITRTLRAVEQARDLIDCAIKAPFYAAKMTYDHLSRLDDIFRRNCDGYSGYEAMFPKHLWIRLRRLDKINQAISWHIAETSGEWHVPLAHKQDVPIDYEYNFFSILSKLFYIYQNEVSWDVYFQQAGIDTHIVYYEELTADPNSVVRDIISLLGFDESKYVIDFHNDSGLAPLSEKHKPIYQSTKMRFCDDLLKMGREDNYIEFGRPLDNWNVFFQKQLWMAMAS